MSINELSLKGKTAIITGSGKETGVGAAIARTFARNGANVAIHYVSESSRPRAEKVAADVAGEFGTKTTVVHGSIADQKATREIVSQALTGLGVDHIDILVNNAAATSDKDSLLDVTPEALKQMFETNVYGSIYMTQAVAITGKMPRGGRIINISSVVSKMGLALAASYAASKAAQDTLTACWASELGKSRGITVNTLSLGPFATEASKEYLFAEDGSKTDVYHQFVGLTRAEERVGEVKDIADAALLIASEKSRWITAQYISVSGGITI